MRDVVISLFDFTGVMVEPWLKAGYECYIVDLQHQPGCIQDLNNQNLFRIGADLRNGLTLPKSIIERVAFVSSFPECTNVAVSGAKHFIKKGPRALSLSLDLFATSREFAEDSGAPYFIENPISTFSTYCGKPDYIFNPYEYGGYLPENDSHPIWPEFIASRDAYPKKTCLWTGGGFVMPKKKPVDINAGYSTQYKKLGGKSQKTKNIRSATPRGFAQAVFEANAIYRHLHQVDSIKGHSSQSSGAYITHSIRTSASEQKIIEAINDLAEKNARISKASVSRLCGISREQITRRYSYLFDGIINA
ncbi:TPA: Dcm methylase [Vibrio parahaemolyticus]|nr:Dcm methylase [Vibrio parahaemolyticus]HCH3912925.1 Dcm methylase [Vibrio parahaemolyticus]